MITIIATALLSMAAMKGDAMDTARKSFNNCMIEVHNTAVGEKRARVLSSKPPTRHARRSARRIRKSL